MNRELVVEKQIHIEVKPMVVWNALTDPESIKKYFFGTEAISDWKVGSPLIFRNHAEGKTYEDKGTILRSDPGACLEYSYWSAWSGLKDIPENYSNVYFVIKEEASGALLSLRQEGFANEESHTHAEGGWDMVFKGLKELLES